MKIPCLTHRLACLGLAITLATGFVGCASSGLFNGGNLLSALGFSGNAPKGQTEPEIEIEENEPETGSSFFDD
jgi:hypothetical protein